MEDSEYQCIILASDGVWNMVKAEEAVRIVSTWRQNSKVRLQELHLVLSPFHEQIGGGNFLVTICYFLRFKVCVFQ